MSATTSSFTKSNLKDIAMSVTASEKHNSRHVHQRQQVNSEEHQARQLQMLNSFADNLVELANKACTDASEKGYGWTKVVEYYLPGFDKIENNGEIQTVPRHSPELTHWAGRDANPSKDAVPIVMLLQGVRERTNTGYTLRPDLLAGGKTSLQIAQEKLSNARLDCSFNVKKKSLIITAIWIEADWAAFVARRQQQRLPGRFPRNQQTRGSNSTDREHYVAPTEREPRV